jgi:hypothetical protein
MLFTIRKIETQESAVCLVFVSFAVQMLIGGVSVTYTAAWVMSLKPTVEAPMPEWKIHRVGERIGVCCSLYHAVDEF